MKEHMFAIAAVVLGANAAMFAQTVTIGSTGYGSIQAAINAAQPGDIIELSSGAFGAAETNALVMNGKTNITIRGAGPLATTFMPASMINHRLNPSPSNPTSTPWAYAGGGYWPKPSNNFSDTPVPASSEPWRPYVYVANSVGITLEAIGFDFASVTGTNRNGNNVAITGVLAHNIDSLLLTNVSLRGLSTENNYNQEIMLALVNDAAPYSPTNKGSITIRNCDFYNINRGGVRARFFVDVDIFDTNIQKSPNSDTLANAVGIDSLADLSFVNSLVSGFQNPFQIWQSTAFIINDTYRWPGHDSWVGAPPTQTVDIVNSTISEAYFGIWIGSGGWSLRELVLNVTNSYIINNRGSGVAILVNDANHYTNRSSTINIDNTEISGNGFGSGSYGFGIWHGPSMARNTLNVRGSTFYNNNLYDYRGIESISADGRLSLNMTGNSFAGTNTLRVAGGSSTYNISGNYYGEANPDIMNEWEEITPVPVITNIYTDAARTITRDVLAVCSTCPYTTVEAATAAATGDDLIYVFDAPAITGSVSIDSDRTMWTRSGIIVSNSGEIVIDAGITLTLDGVDLTGPINISTNTIGIILNQAPELQPDASSLFVRGVVAWTPCFVDVYALLSPTNSSPVGNTTNGWAVMQKLNDVGMNLGSVSGLITNLNSNAVYHVQLVGVVSTNLPGTPRTLDDPKSRWTANLNNCDKDANYWCGWTTGIHYTGLVAYASTDNGNGGFLLEDGDTLWNDNAPLGYPAGSPATITWGELRALIEAGENQPGIYSSPLEAVAIPLDDPRSVWYPYLWDNQKNACGFGDNWQFWGVPFSYSDLTNAYHTNACFAVGNLTLYSPTFSDWSDYDKLAAEVASFGNEVRLVENPPLPCEGLPNIYGERMTLRLIKEVDVPDLLSEGTVGATNLTVSVEVDVGQTVTVNVYQGELSDTPYDAEVATSSSTPSFDGLLDADGRWYVQTIRNSSAGSTTNEFGVERRTYQPDSFYLISMSWDFSGTNNTMGGALGIELANGLLSPGFGEEGDQIYVANTNLTWTIYEWDGSAWSGLGGASLSMPINPKQSFWLRTSAAGGERTATYRARASTGGQSLELVANIWNNISWPLPFGRSQAQGWGFPVTRGASTSRNADQLRIGNQVMFLDTAGQWRYTVRPNALATNVLTPGMTFQYRPKVSGFTWTVE